MPEISSIIYEKGEDLNKYLYDNYYSTENLEYLTVSAKPGTGEITSKIFELELNTGVTANSIAMVNYNNILMNPYYAEAVWKMYMNSMDDVFCFFGFKETLSEPTYNMIESHAGFMIYNGKLYASVANGYDQQRVELVGIDCTRVENFKIENYKFFIMPLPEVEESLGLPRTISIKRVWKEYTSLSNFPPENMNHHIVQYITNYVGATKFIKFNRFIYKEVYAD